MDTKQEDIDLLSYLSSKKYNEFLDLFMTLNDHDSHLYMIIIKQILIDNKQNYDINYILTNILEDLCKSKYYNKFTYTIAILSEVEQMMVFNNIYKKISVVKNVKCVNLITNILEYDKINKTTYSTSIDAEFISLLLQNKYSFVKYTNIFKLFLTNDNINVLTRAFNDLNNIYDETLKKNVINGVSETATEQIKTLPTTIKSIGIFIRICCYLNAELKEYVKPNISPIYIEYKTNKIIDTIHKFYALSQLIVLSNFNKIIELHKKYKENIEYVDMDKYPHIIKIYMATLNIINDYDIINDVYNLIKIFFETMDNVFSSETITNIINIIDNLFINCYTIKKNDNIEKISMCINKYLTFLPIIIDGYNDKITNPHVKTDAVQKLLNISNNSNIYDYTSSSLYYIHNSLVKYLETVKYNTWNLYSFVEKHTLEILEFMNIIKSAQSEQVFYKNIYNTDNFLYSIINRLEESMTDIIITMDNTIDESYITDSGIQININKHEKILSQLKILTGIINFICESCKYINISCDIKLALNMNFNKICMINLNQTYLNYILHENLKKYYTTILKYIINYYNYMITSKNVYIRGINNENLINICEIINEQNIHVLNLTNLNKDVDLGDVPIDFIDPMCSVLIEKAIMIPGATGVFDKDYMMLYLRKTKTNPFTSVFTTIDTILEYNNTEEIKLKLDRFNLTFERYMRQKNKTKK